MIDGARQLRPITRLPVAAAPPALTAPLRTVVPVILRVTEAEAVGAQMRVGRLRVVDRAIRQLARLRNARVVIATDGSVPLPRRLPANIECRELDGDVAAGLAALAAELGPETAIVGADTVRLQAGRFDDGIRVMDRASRRAAAGAVFADLRRDSAGLLDRLVNGKLSALLTRLLFVNLPIAPALLTLMAGFVGVYGALMVATGTAPNVVLGFAVLWGYLILDGCAAGLARVRLHQSGLGAWLDALVGDFVGIVLILAVGRALWAHGGTFLDMKMAAVGAALTLFYAVVTYRELVRQHVGDVGNLRWWFTYWQSLRTVSGAGSRSIKLVTILGRRDVIVAAGLVLALFDQLPIVLLLLLIVAISRAGAALVQLLTPDRRIHPGA